MKPGGSKPSGELKDVIASSFGGLDQFREAFLTEDVGTFSDAEVGAAARLAGSPGPSGILRNRSGGG